MHWSHTDTVIFLWEVGAIAVCAVVNTIKGLR